jgi:hypothetical protein
MTQDTTFEFLEYGMRDLLMSGLCFIRSVLRHTFTIFGEQERVWLGFLLNNIDRQRAKNVRYSPVAEDENHVRLVTALKSGRLSGECGLGFVLMRLRRLRV